MPVFDGAHCSPPSPLTYTPPVLMATVTRSDVGSGSTVCTAAPPKPGCQFGRCGWSHSPRTSSKVRPPSSLRHRDVGSQPAHTTSGRSAVSGCSCQTRASAAPVSAGKAIGAASLSVQVAVAASATETSSDNSTVGPQCSL